jgi:hypothetical protein
MPNVNRFATLLFATLLMPLTAARAGRAPRRRWIKTFQTCESRSVKAL